MRNERATIVIYEDRVAGKRRLESTRQEAVYLAPPVADLLCAGVTVRKYEIFRAPCRVTR